MKSIRVCRDCRNAAIRFLAVSICAVLAGCDESPSQQSDGVSSLQWLAGDHHIHSQYSVSWDGSVEPSAPELRGHGTYTIPHNAVMARHFGLDWTVATDHGGRAHSRISIEQAYPTLLIAREAVPDLIQFYGVELNPPGADHASVIVAQSADEAEQIYSIESQFDRSNVGRLEPLGPEADDESRMLEALEFMEGFAQKPVVIANHPARTSDAQGFGRTGPTELRDWNDTAPEIAIGMEGAPGHQAAGLIPENYPREARPRGVYPRVPTRGGFDLMTAELGGVWDAMLGEGRKWWITATSDSHRHWTEGGNDFWPGEYSKTYVYASKTYSSILQSLREGRVFVTTGDLIEELEFTVSSGTDTATVGGSLVVSAASDLVVTIRVKDPSGSNYNGDLPEVRRIDLIVGNVNPSLIEAAERSNPSTHALRRFTEADWVREGDYLSMNHRIAGVEGSVYLRIRGTNTDEMEPLPDELGENPWQDLWFYSNPVFVFVPSG